MSPRWGGWRRDGIPDAVRAAIGGRERLLAWAQDPRTGSRIVAGSWRLYAVAPDTAAGAAAGRPWHLVDAGVWDPTQGTLKVTWVDRAPALTATIVEQNGLPETLRERVQASVVLADFLELGERRTARVVVRRNLETGDLLAQTILGPGVSSADPHVLAVTTGALARLREQVGLE